MNRKMMLKLSGGLFAVGIAATSLFGPAQRTSADTCGPVYCMPRGSIRPSSRWDART